MNSHNENLLLESLPGNNLTPRDLKSTDRFTAEESTMREREGKQIRGQTGQIGRGGCKRDHAREGLRKRQILFPHSVEREEEHSETKKSYR